jgi:hypothetical protein
MRTSRLCALSFLLALILIVPAMAQEDGARLSGLALESDSTGYTLSLDGAEFHSTPNEITGERLIEVPGTTVRVALWSESAPQAEQLQLYAISLGGSSVATVRSTSYTMKLRHGAFDPAVTVRPVEPGLQAAQTNSLYLVQFVTQPLPEYRAAIEELGGVVHQFIPNHAHYAELTPAVRDAVAALPFVRWIGPVHPAYKLEEEIREQIVTGAEVDPRRYSIMLHERGPEAQKEIVTTIEGMGGEVHGTTPLGFRIEATLTIEQVRAIADFDAVMFIDRKSRLETDMDIVREIGGANYVETIAGFSGQGVRAEVADTEIDTDHPEWSAPPIIHVAGASSTHGTSCYGILFARGAVPQARGLIPSGTGIFAYSDGLLGGGPTRYTHTAELVDPAGSYRAVLQTNSTGDARTFFYTTISAEMDDILFINDIAITQSQSNAGNQDSRPQAWAKNIISGGAVDHFNTLTRDDDCWSCGSGSIGPADDGRIKPDLCFFYDLTYTATAGGGYTEFGGTSGATPSIAGHLGLFFQMWSEQAFGNDVAVPGGTVFENRPHMTTAKAALINTANQYTFTGTTHDMTRMHQGWGMPSVQNLYDLRNNIHFIDETELLGNMETKDFLAYVQAGEPALKVTMVYADPMGTPGANEHRINDLTLKVTSPSSVVYWGNYGLDAGNWSVAGGSANTIDTVENVFVENPESGVWTVEVIASEVNQDSHVETPEMDADFALVVSGATLANCTSDGRIQLDSTRYSCSDTAAIRVVDCDLNLSDTVVDTVTVTIDSNTEPGGESVLLTETAAETADFRGSIALSTTDAAGVLQVSAGDAVTATYIDADDGQGGTNVAVTDDAVVDCTPPVISNVATADVQPRAATITFDSDEDATGSVRYGLSCGALSQTVSKAGFTTAHSIDLLNLVENTTYFYAVDAEDEAGNGATNDNGGLCYSFSTPDIPDYFTELFSSGNDLDNLSLTFTPNGSYDYYAGCAEAITVLPVDPSGGTVLSLSDDGSAPATLSGGETVSLHGTSYGSFYVNANGNVTFTASDGDYSETLADHFDTPRISALFDDLNPTLGGTLSWKQMADRAVVTWQDIREYGASSSLNTFQIEMRFDGTIVLSYLAITANDGLAGLSEGNGLPGDYFASDLSALGPCGPTCSDGILNQGEDLIDCGGPCPACECLIDDDCDDGEFCTGVESCDGYGFCQAGGDPCPGQNCDEVQDICVPYGCDLDGTCEMGEDCNNCPSDCFTGVGASCGNGICEILDGEDCLSCPDDCDGKQTGKPSGRFCCGNGGVNPVGCADSRCVTGGFQCSTVPGLPSCCGDLICEGTEDGFNCEIDCGPPPYCGDGSCDPGEDSCNCATDCGPPAGSELFCDDGIDDDCDGFTDCDDADCDGTPECTCDPRGTACTSGATCCSGRCHREFCK